MVVNGVQEPEGKMANEEHDHPALAKKVKLVDGTGTEKSLPDNIETTGGNKLPIIDINVVDILKSILLELKRVNRQFEIITDNKINEGDVE